MTIKDMLKRLRDLSKQAGGNAYERTKLAAALLADREWIASEHGGGDFAALEALEDGCFHDLAVPLTDLIRLYQRFPTEPEWEKHGCNLRKMLLLLKPEPQKRPEVRRATIKELDAAVEEKTRLAAMVHTQEKNLTVAKSELQTLRETIARLEKENTKLKGRIEELERIVEGRLGKRAS